MNADSIDLLQKSLPDLFDISGTTDDWGEKFLIEKIESPESSLLGNRSERVTISRSHSNIEKCEIEQAAAEMYENFDLDPEISLARNKNIGIDFPSKRCVEDGQSVFSDPECISFYLPFHRFPLHRWGIYLHVEGIIEFSREILKRSNNRIDLREAIYAARLFMLYHQVYHYKTEYFISNLEIIHRKPLYNRLFHGGNKTKIDGIEECNANAYALRNVIKEKISPQIVGILKNYTNCGNKEMKLSSYKSKLEQCQFAELLFRQCFPRSPRIDSGIWSSFLSMFGTSALILDRVFYITSIDSPLCTYKGAGKQSFITAKNLVKRIRKHTDFELIRKGANHDIYKSGLGKTVPIPRHSKDLAPWLVRSIIKEVGLEMSSKELVRS